MVRRARLRPATGCFTIGFLQAENNYRCNTFNYPDPAYYAQLRNLTNTFQENAGDLLDACSQSRLQYVLRRLDSLCEEAEMRREYASQVSSEYQAQVDIAQNHIMKILTVVTTVCMPLSLIAGWYGMNFMIMLELHWEYGYPAVSALSALVVDGCILYFRKKHLW